MKTKDEIEEKASEYVEDVKDRIDSYAYLDVQEAFAEGAKWMQEQVNGDSTSYETALNIDVVIAMLPTDEEIKQQMTTDHYCHDKGRYRKIRLDRIQGAKMIRDLIKQRIEGNLP